VQAANMMNWSARRTATETNVPQRHTHTHTLSEALISRRITRNDDHHGATHPSSSRWRECGHDGGAQRPRETSTGGDAQYRNRATTTARGRAQDRIPVLLQLFNCWLTTCNGVLGSQEVCVRLMRGRPPTCARNDNTQRAHKHRHTHTHTLTHTHAHTHRHTHTHTHAHSLTHTHTPRARRQAVERRARWSGSALGVKGRE
jgi:hypothetical protein